jgi:hypothetical protein
MCQPTPLSSTATLELRPPHRFNEHVDGVLLFDGALLIGPQADCHVRCRQMADRAVITQRGEKWLGKIGLTSDFQELTPGNRITLQSLAITLEKA